MGAPIGVLKDLKGSMAHRGGLLGGILEGGRGGSWASIDAVGSLSGWGGAGVGGWVMGASWRPLAVSCGFLGARGNSSYVVSMEEIVLLFTNIYM